MRFAARFTPAACALVVAAAPVSAQITIPNVLADASEFSDDLGTGRRVDGYLQIAARQGMTRWYYAHGIVPSSVRFEMTTLLRGGPDGAGYGIAFARPSRDVNQWCTFTIDSDGHYRLVKWGGDAAIPWTQSSLIRTGIGAQNTLAVEVRGQQITLFINGTQVNSWFADRDVSGNIGVSVGQGVEVRFLSYSIYSAGAGNVVTTTGGGKAGPALPVGGGGGALLFVEDFSRFGVADDTYARSEYAGGGLLVNARQGMVRWTYDRGIVPSNARITMTAQFRGGPNDARVGFVFGRPSRDDATWLGFHVGPDGQWYLEGYGATNNLGPTYSGAVIRGYNAINQLMVEVRGRNVALYVNGQYVGAYTASQDASGYVGVTATAGAQVLFTNLRVDRLN